MMAALVRQARFVGGVCAGLAVGSAAAGAEYDWQVAGSYGQDDAAGIVDSSRWTLGGSYYPKPVDDTRGPYELAPFLTRSSYVTVGLSRASEEMVSVGYIGGEPGFIERIIELYSRYTAETSEWSVAGRYVWRESGWFAGGGGGGTLKPVGPPQGGAAVPGRGGTSGNQVASPFSIALATVKVTCRLFAIDWMPSRSPGWSTDQHRQAGWLQVFIDNSRQDRNT